jgi:Ca2+-binding RTX toxin-like protein
MPIWKFSPTSRNVAADTADLAFDLGVHIVDDLPMTASSTSVIYEGPLGIVTPSAIFKLTLTGQSFSTLGSTVTGGTITQLDLKIAGVSYVTIIGLNLSGAEFGNLAIVDFNSTVLLERLLSSGNDRMTGTALGDSLRGMAGNDRLIGNAGSDDLSGGGGSDVLFGGAGVDDLAGGAGADKFVFNRSVYAAGTDYIADFSGIDTIVLDNDAFRGIGGPGKLDASRFKNIDTGMPDTNDRFYYSQVSGALWYDPDGSGFKSWVLFADLQGGARLTAADFLIIN